MESVQNVMFCKSVALLFIDYSKLVTVDCISVCVSMQGLEGLIYIYIYNIIYILKNPRWSKLSGALYCGIPYSPSCFGILNPMNQTKSIYLRSIFKTQPASLSDNPFHVLHV